MKVPLNPKSSCCAHILRPTGRLAMCICCMGLLDGFEGGVEVGAGREGRRARRGGRGRNSESVTIADGPNMAA